MKVFVWKDVENCSERYHPNGGVVVFAESENRARFLANSQSECNIKIDEMPNDVRDVVGGEERVYIMPNAGCC